ncbi:GNAT family N-acetyltransferase [Alkalicaulis satelles]|uniref:GNAT family N-acetyltransferase n=1 Tax=Alkalicaulis satelles TaxID=2609175 RepID=A0A5M6ZGN1_9PROT|nr:GNAT family N-acetyltransferase [Alkalicaulis satelles]KAA5802298.1 GNAT family N-acetyltransferase [Alkalicaulis satelles]
MTGPAESARRIEQRTARLRLVALDAELARLQLEDREAFFAALAARREPAWPPELIDLPSMRRTLDALMATPEETGWRAWAFLMLMQGGPDRAVGTGGFYGPPGADGVIEVGYAMLPSFREQGLATEAVEGLLAWAFSDPRVKSVRARTLAHLIGARRVLEKTGFSETGETAEPEGVVVHYQRSAP